MITADSRNFCFPSPRQLDAMLGAAPDQTEISGAVTEAIARGYAEGLAQGMRVAEAQARNLAETAQREGFEAGRVEAVARVEQAASALREALADFERERVDIGRQAESFCVSLVLATVERLIESDTVAAEFASRLVRKALEVLAPEPPSAIHLNPADRALIGDCLAGLPLKDNATLAPGHARVEAGRLVVEGGIDQAFAQIKSALLDVKERRAGGSTPE